MQRSFKDWDNITNEVEDTDGWIMTYADLISVVLGFFIIMYSFSTLDEQKFEEMRENLSETFNGEKLKKDAQSDIGFDFEKRQIRALQMLISMLNLGRNLEEGVAKVETAYFKSQAKKELGKDVEKKLEKNFAQLGSDSESQKIEIVIADKFLFKSGSADLNRRAIKELRKVARVIAQTPKVTGVRVVGHTDSDKLNPRSRFRDNWYLSAARAAEVAKLLIKAGVNRKFIDVGGKGDIDPLFPERDKSGKSIPANKARNRRVIITLETSL